MSGVSVSCGKASQKIHTVTIFGSCVSREQFNEQMLKEATKIDNYFFKNSIVAMFEKEFPLLDEEIVENGKFLRRMINYDFNKTVRKLIEEKVSDYLVVDFGELRCGIIRIDWNDISTGVTDSLSAKNTLSAISKLPKYEGLKYRFGENPYWYSVEKLNGCIDAFVDFVKRIYDPSKIILIEPHNCFEFLSEDLNLEPFEDYKKLIRENNIIFNASEYFYNKMNRKITKIRVPDDVIGDKNHWLGLHPLHYQKSCYEYISGAIYEVINHKATQSDVDALFNDYSNRLKKEIRAINLKANTKQ